MEGLWRSPVCRAAEHSCYMLSYLVTYQQKYTNTMSSFFRSLWVCNKSGVLKLTYQSIHESFSTWINILCVRTCHISRNGPFHTAALTPVSAQHTAPSIAPHCNFPQSQKYDRLLKGLCGVFQHCCREGGLYSYPKWVPSFFSRGAAHHAAWETSASEGRNYTKEFS